MICKSLGGACDMKFQAESFDEIAEKSQKHGKEMFEIRDEPHLAAMNKMRELMKDSDEMKKWMDEKRKEFDGLAED